MQNKQVSFSTLSSLTYSIDADATLDQLIEELECLTTVLNEHHEERAMETTQRSSGDWFALYATRQARALVQALRARVPEAPIQLQQHS